MKFEYDSKIGGMTMKQNPQIYFSRSMSGGLRVDDQINNVKYIIERNGNIKFLSGIKREVNIYDQRNAHIIAERVKRMFGPSHEYSNYKLFLKGYHGIKSYDDFVSESLWKGTINRSKTGDLRQEEGIKVDFPLGKVYLVDLGCGVPYKLNPNNDQYWYYLKDNDIYLFGYVNDSQGNSEYTYFKYDEDNEDEDSYHLTQLATSDYDMVEDDFIMVRAMLDIDSSYEGMNFKTLSNHYVCEFDKWKGEYIIYDDYDNARSDAFEYQKNLLDDIKENEGILDGMRGSFGDDFIDTDALEEWRKEDYENYVNDIESENGEHGNRLFDELISNGIIEDTDEYFERVVDDTESDEDEDEDEGYLDYESPLFDIDDMKEEYVEKLCNTNNDVVDWYISNFGSDGLENYVDYDKLADLILDSDGLGNSLATYDGEEIEFSEDDYDLYIYKING